MKKKLLTDIKSDKGFSLVELIIVIAIMAVLIGMVGTQVVPYMNHAREGKDLQILDSYSTAGVSIYSMYAESLPTTGTVTLTIQSAGSADECAVDNTTKTAYPGSADAEPVFMELVGTNYLTEADEKFSSAKGKSIDKITVTIDLDDRDVTVQAFAGSDEVFADTEVKSVL